MTDHQTLAAFIDFDDAPAMAKDAPDLETVDRSTLARWALCPWQAAAIESGRVKHFGLAAEAGEAIHGVLGLVTRTWVEDGRTYLHDGESGVWAARDELKRDVEFELKRLRPDLQPAALEGMRASIWAWVRFLTSISPENVLAFDGGHDIGRSSQFAYDFPDLGTRATSELDLAFKFRDSPEDVLEIVDYKTGFGRHDVYGIAEDFQFQMHAMLSLHRFPTVKTVRIRVWNTRFNDLTDAAYFTRDRFDEYLWRVRSAVETRRCQRDNPECWPMREKCGICDCAALCPVADEPLLELADPPALLRKMVAIEARLDGLKEIASGWVDAHGREIESGNLRFGRRKPPAKRKNPAALYEINGNGRHSDSQ